MGELLTREEIAKQLVVTPQTIWNLGKAGKIPFYKVKGSLRYNLQEVKEHYSRPAKNKNLADLPKWHEKLNDDEKEIFGILRGKFRLSQIKRAILYARVHSPVERKKIYHFFTSLVES